MHCCGKTLGGNLACNDLEENHEPNEFVTKKRF
jgi:hypothetical protein